MWYTKSDKPEGPYSTPVRINNPPALPFSLGYDNSVFIDDNGKWYLVVKNGQPNGAIVELGANGQPAGAIYNLAWLNPSPSYPYSWAEGPVMWKYGGYYFYSFARDVAGGQKVMRSKTLTADQSAWEMLGDFFNESDPQKSSSFFSGPNHSSPVVMAPDSTFWVVHPIYLRYSIDNWSGQGRQGLLNQVRYDANLKPTADYPVNKAFTAPNLPSSGIPWMVPKSDFFDFAKLNPEWSFLGYTPDTKFSLTERPGWLRLTAKSSAKANTVIKNDGEHNYSLITRVEFDSKSVNDQAGLWLIRGDEKQNAKLYSSVKSDGTKILGFSFNSTVYEVENTIGEVVWLKIVRVSHLLTGFISGDGINWTQIGEAFNVSAMDSFTDNSSWSGTRQGLYVQGSTAYFDLYIYRDAYTPILAECPANQYGTTRGLSYEGIKPLDGIHPNDWALYAGVEFGDGTYYETADSVEFIASSVNSRSSVEVWLDSIDSGTKIAECPIENTGNYTSFKTFRAKVGPVSGRHDVYLRFTSAISTRLMQLRSFSFIRQTGPSSSAQGTQSNPRLEVYPNPAKNRLNVSSGSDFHQLQIFGLDGKLVFSTNYPIKNRKASIPLNLGKGTYILKLEGKNFTGTSRFLVDP
jgi:beta-xylosidase